MTRERKSSPSRGTLQLRRRPRRRWRRAPAAEHRGMRLPAAAARSWSNDGAHTCPTNGPRWYLVSRRRARRRSCATVTPPLVVLVVVVVLVLMLVRDGARTDAVCRNAGTGTPSRWRQQHSSCNTAPGTSDGGMMDTRGSIAVPHAGPDRWSGRNTNKAPAMGTSCMGMWGHRGCSPTPKLPAITRMSTPVTARAAVSAWPCRCWALLLPPPHTHSWRGAGAAVPSVDVATKGRTRGPCR